MVEYKWAEFPEDINGALHLATAPRLMGADYYEAIS